MGQNVRVAESAQQAPGPKETQSMVLYIVCFYPIYTTYRSQKPMDRRIGWLQGASGALQRTLSVYLLTNLRCSCIMVVPFAEDKTVFQKASPTRTFEEIADQIRAAIVEGRLQPGDRLPAGRELAQTFGVGRSTLLAALRVLEQSGLIVIRPGTKGGAFVTAPSLRQVSESLDLLLRREGASVEELAEFRVHLEGQCFYWAALRADESGRDRHVTQPREHCRPARHRCDARPRDAQLPPGPR